MASLDYLDWDDDVEDMNYEPPAGDEDSESDDIATQVDVPRTIHFTVAPDADENAESEDEDGDGDGDGDGDEDEDEDENDQDFEDIEEDESGQEEAYTIGTESDDGETTLRIPASHLRQLLLQSGGNSGHFREILRQNGLLDDGIARRWTGVPNYEWPPVPNPEGRKLMQSGTFGYHAALATGFEHRFDVHYQVMLRELGLDSPRLRRTKIPAVAQSMTPCSTDAVINFDNRGYSGQFSEDGEFFFTCNQDGQIRMYDTSNPYRWRYFKSIQHHDMYWTIADASLSPDNRFLASCSLNPFVSLVSTEKGNDRSVRQLDLSRSTSGHRYNFGTFSIRFGGDGRELVAGTNSKQICVYDIEADRPVLHIGAHHNDVNAVCYGEQGSPHILYSGSDDTTVKVWDRRSLANNRPAGVFLGHTEGVTYIDSKGDGRYIISNSKDQTMKLWDIRKSVEPDTLRRSDVQPRSHFDYRWQDYEEHSRVKPDRDCSLMTFRGHKVMYTLIRCHFSPSGSTNGRYVYSGSADGHVYIWNMDGTIKSTIDVTEATRQESRGSRECQTKVRDASWHPSAPMIAATSWNGGDGHNGTCTVHSWNDETNEDGEEVHVPQLSARLGPWTRSSRRYVIDDFD